MPLEAFLVNKGENKIQNPLTHTQQAPPLPLAEGTHQPLPAPISLTPRTLGPRPRGRGSGGGLKIPGG